MSEPGTLDPHEAALRERRWLARQRLQSPGLVLAWFGMAMTVLHSGLVVVPMVKLAASPLREDGAVTALSVPYGELVLQDLAAGGALAVSTTWMMTGLGLSAAGFALRNGTHRAAAQGIAVGTIPLGMLAIAELAWIQPCSVPGTVVSIGLHIVLAGLGGWLALRLGSEAGREAFVEGESD